MSLTAEEYSSMNYMEQFNIQTLWINNECIARQKWLKEGNKYEDFPYELTYNNKIIELSKPLEIESVVAKYPCGKILKFENNK